MKRGLRCAAVFGVLLATLGAALVAGRASAAPKASHASVTIRLLAATSIAFPHNVIIANFQRAYPDIKVETEYVPPQLVATVLATELRAGSAADVLSLGPGYGSALSVLNFKDYLYDLSGRKWVKRLTKTQLIGAKVGKVLYAYSVASSTPTWVYNVDLFNKAGIKPPSTWAQLATACGKLSATGVTPIAFAPGDVRAVGVMTGVSAADVYASDPKWNTKRLHGQVKFATSPGWKESFQRILDLKAAGCFSPGAAGQTGAQAEAAFGNGQAAIYPIASFQWSGFLQYNSKMNFGVFAAPGGTAASLRLVVQPTYQTAVNKNNGADHLAAALKFVDFLARAKQTDTFARASGGVLTGDALKSAKLPDYVPKLKPLAPLFKKPIVTSYVAIWPNPSIGIAMQAGLTGLFTGQKNIDQVLSDLDAAYDKGHP